MQTIFDTLATSKLIFIITFLLLTIAIVFTIVKFRLLRKGIIGISITALLSCILLFTTSLFWSGKHGYVHHITHLSINNNKLCFLDNKKRSTTPYASLRNFDMYRLFVVDIENGKRLYRGYMGLNVKWLKDKDNLVLFSNSKTYDVFDIEKTEFVRKIDKQYLVNKFTQCSAGIESIDFIKDFMILKVKNGRNYYYEPFDDKIVEEPDSAHYLYKKFSCYYDKITYIENGRERDIYKFKPLKPGEKRTHLFQLFKGEHEPLICSEESFIEATCIGFFPENNLMVILSYETTDKVKYLITALDMNLKMVWKINHETLAASDFFSAKQPLVTDAVLVKNNIYFGIGGFVYCIDRVNGRIKWKQRF